MSLKDIQEGIDAIKNGDPQRGAQLLRQGLDDGTVKGNVRAKALMWLASTNNNLEFQIQCYRAAQNADPTSAEIKNRLNALLATQMPNPPDLQIPPPPTGNSTQTAPAVPVNLPASSPAYPMNVPRMWEFGVVGGPEGVGTGFMVVRDGLIATARFVVGSETRVMLLTRDNKRMPGQVVRSYPMYDLAFIRVDLSVSHLRDMSPSAAVAPHTTLIADDYTEHQARAECRATQQVVPAGWFPTTFPETLPHTFTGAPLLDVRNDLVGMLTRNASRHTGFLYALHITLIRRKLEEYYTEFSHDADRVYCGTCGSLSKNGAEGKPYCEVCGAMFPFAQKPRLRPNDNSYHYHDSKE